MSENVHEKTGTKESFIHDLKLTYKNYANMYSRLQLRNHMASILIVYYSILSIILALIGKYFQISLASKNILEFASIFTAIIILVSSLMISMANYPSRIQKAVEAIDSLKKMKKEVEATDNDFSLPEYKDYIGKFHEIVDKMELRSDIDFYRTSKSVNEHVTYFSRPQRAILLCEIFFERLFYFVLLVGPIVVITIVIC